MQQNFYNFKLLSAQDNKLQYQEDLTLIYILEGRGTLDLPQTKAQYQIKQADIFVINSFQAYSLNLEADSLAIALSIGLNFVTLNMPEVTNIFFECKSFLFNEAQQSVFDELRKAFAKAFYSFYKNEANLTAIMRVSLMEILFILNLNFQADKQLIIDSNLDYLRTIITYIHQNYSENLTLDEIAENVNLSSAYLSRMFKDSINQTLTDYISELRIKHAKGLLSSQQTITEIAYGSGFPSHNAMIAAFKKHENMTPRQYREDLLISKEPTINNVDAEGFSTAFQVLISYLDDYEAATFDKKIAVSEIFVDTNSVKAKSQLSHQKIINVGYAKNVLDLSVKNQIKTIQKDIKFDYLRIKGILDDDMMVYSTGTDFKEIINYVYVEEVIDFILANDAKPFIEIGHMPIILAENKALKIRVGSTLSGPDNVEKWSQLVLGLMKHLKLRYGEAEVNTWLISPWISPEYTYYDAFSLKTYQETYLAAYNAIKAVFKAAVIVGPGTSINDLELLEHFLLMKEEHDISIDYIALKSYASIDPSVEKEALELSFTPDAFPLAVSKDENYLSSVFRQIQKLLKQFNLNEISIIVEEWSNNIWQRDLANDTLYKSSYIFKNVLEHSHHYYGIAYHSLIDQLDEVAPSEHLFGGGFGLFTRDGIPKSAYYAYQMLAKVGKQLLAKGDGYYISKDNDSIQIYLYNYAHYDLLYRYRHTTNLSVTNRYDIFNHQDALAYNIQLSSLLNGQYEITYHTINEEHGSAFDTWRQMGAMKKLNKAESNYLKSKSRPQYLKNVVNSSGVLNIKVDLAPHETKFIEIKQVV